MSQPQRSWHLLLRAIENQLAGKEGATPALQVFECDHTADGEYSPLAGFQAARDSVRDEANHGGVIPPVLIIGIHANVAAHLDVNSDGDSDASSLLHWPGAAYLQYGFTARELQDACKRTARGAAAPLPPDIVTRSDVLRASANVRHWLEGRLRYEEASLLDFGSAARGELRLVAAYLAPRTPISKQHQRMLDRLWDLTSAVVAHAPDADGLTRLREAIDRFVATWVSLEVARAECRAHLSTADTQQTSQLAGRVCEEIQSGTSHLSAAIAATKRLDEQIKQKWRP